MQGTEGVRARAAQARARLVLEKAAVMRLKGVDQQVLEQLGFLGR